MNALALTVWNTKIFKVFSLCCHGNQSSSWNSILWSVLKEHDLRIISVKFDWNLIVSLGEEDFFVIVNRRTDDRPITIAHPEHFMLRWAKKETYNGDDKHKFTGMFHSLPKVKILALIKLKIFVGNKFHNATMMISVLEQIDNIVGKGENTVNQYFLFSRNVFKSSLF